ncbi:MAG: dephospho-CoA kinase [Gammaproteobacteria bacterium]|nr:dephospho-CoA kinase [Gammaproteobacteria bacterium]
MFKVGLTGGIGSGKTAASDHFARLGAAVIDTDLISRELVEPGQAALADIVGHFGSGILDPAGHLDRAQLRERVFGDPAERRILEGILHPRIRATMLARAEQASAPYALLVIPLLIETGQQALVDRVLLIDVPEDIQRSRVAARDGQRLDQVERILAAQTDRATRQREADDTICNDSGLEQLQAAVEAMHRKYLQLAGQRGR